MELQKTSFKWDLIHKGKLCKDIAMTPHVSYLRVNTKEADLFCVKHTNQNKHAKQLWREWHCPTNKTDNHLANHKAKTQHQIVILVLRKDENWLQEMSEQCSKNAFCGVQFGCHNEMGIHGVCLVEMLHALLLGACTGHIFQACWQRQQISTWNWHFDHAARKASLLTIQSRMTKHAISKRNQGWQTRW